MYLMQRSIIAIFTVLFIGFAVFGLSFMAHQGTGAHDGCLAGGAFNAACPQDIGAFSMIDLHFTALSNFSSATFSHLPDIGMLAFLGVVFAMVFGSGALLRPDRSFAPWRHAFDLIRSSFHRQLTEWIALHNKGDALIILRS